MISTLSPRNLLNLLSAAPPAQGTPAAAPSANTDDQEGRFSGLLAIQLAEPNAPPASRETPSPRQHEPESPAIAAEPDPALAAGLTPVVTPYPPIQAQPTQAQPTQAQPTLSAPALAEGTEQDDTATEDALAEALCSAIPPAPTTPPALSLIWPATAPAASALELDPQLKPQHTAITPPNLATPTPQASTNPSNPSNPSTPQDPAPSRTTGPALPEPTAAPASRTAEPLPNEEPAMAMPAEERQALPPLSTSGLDTTALASPHRETPTPAFTNLQSTAADPSYLRLSDPFTRTAPAPTQISIEAPIRSPEFQTEFADKVIWVAGRKEQWAELSLNPANMGTVEIRLSMTEEGAGAQFYSPHAQVREALEAAMPRLREMLSQAGIDLQEASVRDQSLPRRESSEGQTGQPRGDRRNTADGPPHLEISRPNSRVALGLVDYYA